MTKRILLVLLASLAIGVQAFAQNVSGKVADAKGEAIPGASVIVKGTTTGTMTDLDGAYAINAGSNATLVFSCIGYTSQEVAVNGKGVVNVVLTEDSTLLEETVVIAYGTAKRKDLTGSISTVDGGDIAIQAQGSVTRALEGAVAGLQTSAIDGQPGWDMGIRVRGMGTANVNYSNALVVIDGVPCTDAAPLNGLSPLSSINPKDIESITVLKDAASTALYGSRGANGVVLVTTKTGKAGKTKISFEARMGINTVGANGYFDIIGNKNPGELYETYWEAIYNAAYYGKTTDGAALQGNSAKAAEFASQHLFDYTGSATTFSQNSLGNRMAYKVPGVTYVPTGSGASASSTMTGAYLVNTDGRINPNAQLLYSDGAVGSELITNRFRQEYNVAASGATDKVDYHMSIGYLSDPSYISTSGFDRITARGTVNAQITSWLKSGIKFAYTHRKTNSAEFRWAARNAGNVGQNPFYWANNTTILDQMYARDENGVIKTDAQGHKLVCVAQGKETSVVQSANTYSPLGPAAGTASYNLKMLFDQTLNSDEYDDLDAKGYLRANFLKYFTAEVNMSYNLINGFNTRFYNTESAGPVIGTSSGSNIQKRYRRYVTMNTQQLINYNQDMGKHHVDAMIGHEYHQYDSDGLNYGSAYSLLNDFTGYVNFLGTSTGSGWIGNTIGGFNLDKVTMESYFGRANYIFDSKYYASASIRRDGSSKFKYEENRWGTFWSVGGGWRISAEPWMEGTKGWLDNLKVRASYGVIGNQNGVGNYSGYQTWSYGGSNWTTGQKTYPQTTTLSRGADVNDSLTWEKVNTADAGIDFTLFGGKLAGSFDWFNKQTNNAIFSQMVSYLAAGQNSLTKNTLGIRSTGIELELSYQPVKTKDWDVIISTNGTHYRTTTTSVPVGYGSEALGGCAIEGPTGWTAGGTGSDAANCFLRGVGKDYYNLYLYKYAGVAGNTGVSYYGTDGTLHTGYTKGDADAGNALFWHKVTSDDVAAGKYPGAKAGDDVRTAIEGDGSKYEFGTAIPAWIGGINLKVRYKGLDFSAQMGYQLGGKFLSIDYGSLEVGKLGGSNCITGGTATSRELIGNTWNESNLDAKYPMIYYGGSGAQGGTSIGSNNYTDLALFDASYLSLKNVTLGYTFPSKWMNKAKISNLRVYISADNSLMIYKHSGVDPRRSLVGGVDLGASGYPALAVYSFGVNLDF